MHRLQSNIFVLVRCPEPKMPIIYLYLHQITPSICTENPDTVVFTFWASFNAQPQNIKNFCKKIEKFDILCYKYRPGPTKNFLGPLGNHGIAARMILDMICGRNFMLVSIG